jgi:hypothetical protein
LVVLPLTSPRGRFSLLLPERAFKEAQRMARALGATGR